MPRPEHSTAGLRVLFGTARLLAIWDDEHGDKCQLLGTPFSGRGSCLMPRLIRTFHNAKNEEVGRLTFEEKDERLHIHSSAPPGIDRRFRTERGAANWWDSNVDPETGKIRR